MILSGGFHSCYLSRGSLFVALYPMMRFAFRGLTTAPGDTVGGCLPTYREIGMASICRVATCRDCLSVDWPALTDWSLQGNDLKFTELQSRQVATLRMKGHLVNSVNPAAPIYGIARLRVFCAGCSVGRSKQWGGVSCFIS